MQKFLFNVAHTLLDVLDWLPDSIFGPLKKVVHNQDFRHMDTKEMDAIIHYRHSRDEVAELARAVVPMTDHIKRVGNHHVRGAMKAMLGGEYFRFRDAAQVKSMLLKSVKHMRSTLNEYFPLLHAEMLQNAQNLEDATHRYWRNFARLREETLPVH